MWFKNEDEIRFFLACPLYYRPRVTLLNTQAHIAPLTVRTLLYSNDTYEIEENKIITSLAEEVMFLVALVSLSVCLFVCGQHYLKSYERIGMKFYGRVLSSTRKNWLNFGGDLGIVRWVNEQQNTVIVVAYPDRDAGNDPEPFFFFFFFFF